MYGREYGGKSLNFEASGGLIHASLVMRDKETDSFWSIMTGDALSGELKGTHLEELPLGVKTQWKDWRADHPDTLVLSVDGVEHPEGEYYSEYFDSPDGFRGARADDNRMKTKDTIYAFQLGDKAYAVPYSRFKGGATFQAGGEHFFLYRPKRVAMFYSTLAYRSRDGGFEKRKGVWHHAATGAAFDPEEGTFANGEGATVPRLDGFDTFWFNWSMTHPETTVLTRKGWR